METSPRYRMEAEQMRDQRALENCRYSEVSREFPSINGLLNLYTIPEDVSEDPSLRETKSLDLTVELFSLFLSGQK